MIAASLFALWLGAMAPGTCDEALTAQDEVVSALDSQVAELKAALVERKAEVAALQATLTAKDAQIDTYRKLWLAEAEYGAAERKRATWAERWKVLQYGTLGFSIGVIGAEIAH